MCHQPKNRPPVTARAGCVGEESGPGGGGSPTPSSPRQPFGCLSAGSLNAPSVRRRQRGSLCLLGLNTFQAVIAYDEEDTYAIFLYPEGGLQFLGTRPKESYNVQLELPARVGFSRGDSDDGRREGLFYSVASTEQALRHLERGSNAGVPGVWVFHVGSSGPLEHVEPGGGEGASPGTPQSPAAPTEPPARPGWAPTSPRPRHRGQPSIVPAGLPAAPGQERSRRLQPDGDTPQSYPANPASYSSGHHGVGVEEDVHFNTDVFTYSAGSKETCARHHGRCSPHAFCTDYATGLCCHCQASYYGNGRQCLPEGAVHRLNGKVSGSLEVGRMPVRFQDVDLHAYIVGSDGRAYTAISGVPAPAARALLPLLPLGGLFGWLFALEEPGYENGFSITGAEFTQNLEVTFYPGEEQVHITQTAEGLGPDNYLSLKTHIQGQVPFIPENFTVHVGPYKELYHYSSSAVTSSAHRDYVLTSGAANQTLSYRLRQNITFSGCPHARGRLPPLQRLSVARAFALYDGQEQALRYALAGRIGSAHDDAETPPVNPCHDGTHTCEATARCQPGTGLGYTCECADGYRGDGRGCQDVDECGEGLSQCGPFSVCLNAPGSYRCECRSGYWLAEDGHACVPLALLADPCEDGSHPCAPGDRARCLPRAGGLPACECLPGYTGDGRDCTDVDECAENPCHPAAACYNTPGSFSCRCQPGYEGDGFQCTHAQGSTQRLTPCEHERLYPRVPGHAAQCDERGEYRPLQCHGGTGHCWCVDAAGQEIAGTRTAPGSTPPRCGNPGSSQQLTPCEHERLYPRAVPPGPSPVGDGHVPQCDERGGYRPLQCHGSTGHCWCVDAAGQEIAGTRTAPGSTPPRCGNPGQCRRERGARPLPKSPQPRGAPPASSVRVEAHPARTGGSGKSPSTPSLPVGPAAWVGGVVTVALPRARAHGAAPEHVRALAAEPAGALRRQPPRRPVRAAVRRGGPLHPAAVPRGQRVLLVRGRERQGDPGHALGARQPPAMSPQRRAAERPALAAARRVPAGHGDLPALRPGAADRLPAAQRHAAAEGGGEDPALPAWLHRGGDRLRLPGEDGLLDRRGRPHHKPGQPGARRRAGDRHQLSNLYWTDWNREAPKIETATVNGANRRVLVNKDIGLPNGLTFDPFSKLLCWADAGTKNLECTFPDGAGRRIIQNNLNYPFSIISYADHFYHTDWRRDGVIAVNKETGSFTDEYLPEHRSHLYGITAVYPYCPGARK
uniref:Nidogen 2 n=1 Tax=Anser cygnoides TaxID=8845 RepID=A0A8B9D2V1_ANSCY